MADSDSRNYAVLPDQVAYRIQIDEVDHFDLNTTRAYPLVFTNDFKCFLLEGAPGDGISWHTHMPNVDEVIVGLDGRLKCTLQQDEDKQVIEIRPRELLYLPGGARHELEIVGDQEHRSLVVFPSTRVDREELLEVGGHPYDPDERPVALWMDRDRNEVVTIDENAVTTE